MSINQVMFSGNIAKDPTLKVSADGIWHFANGSIGVKNRVKNKGQWESQTAWVNFKIITKYQDRLEKLVKGEIMLITGKWMSDTYEKDGVKKHFDYVQVEDFEIIKKGTAQDPTTALVNDSASSEDDDIPF